MLRNSLDAGSFLALAGPEGPVIINSGDIVHAWREGNTAAAALLDGSVLRSYDSFDNIKKTLLKTGLFIQIQRSAIVNFKKIKTVSPLAKGDYLLTFIGQAAPVELNAAYTAEARKLFEVKTLDHVEPFDRPTYWLMKENIKYYQKLIYLMTKEELLKNFSDSAGNPVISLLIANFLYQFALKIRAGEAEPLEGGNVRSLWYMIKPAISKLGALEGSDHYKTLSEVMARLVTHKIVTYKEYGLTEEENWIIGKTNPHVILLAEKRSHFKFIQGFNAQYGVSILAAGGIPGMITMEFFTDALKKAITQSHLKEIPIITLTDYDPAGDLLVSTFIDNLKTYNVPKTKFIRLVQPSVFTLEELEAYKYALVGENEATPAMVRKWLKKTGGINGQAYGLETDALMITPSKVKALFYEKAKPYLTGVEGPKKRHQKHFQRT